MQSRNVFSEVVTIKASYGEAGNTITKFFGDEEERM